MFPVTISASPIVEAVVVLLVVVVLIKSVRIANQYERGVVFRLGKYNRTAGPGIYIVLPQAIRNVMPDLLSNTLEVVKLTALGSVVAVPELLYAARQAQSTTFNPTPIVMAALIYFALLWPLVRLLSRLENRALAGRG